MKTENTIKMTIVLILFLLSTGFVSKKNVAKDPKAEKILNAFVIEIGGKSAVSNIENLNSKSQLEFMESGFILERKIVETRSKQYFIKVSSAQTGDIYRVYDGKSCWEKRQSQTREIDGDEKRSFLNTARLLRFAEWEKNLAAYQYAGKINVDGTEMHRIDVTTVHSSKESWYFNTNNYLLVRMEEPLDMPEGSATATTTYSDYRQVNGVKLSFTQTIEMPGQARKITFSEIIANQEIDQNLFSVPK